MYDSIHKFLAPITIPALLSTACLAIALKLTGATLAVVIGLGISGYIFCIFGQMISVMGFVAGIYLLAKGHLMEGFLLTLGSAVGLGLILGAMVGAAVPWLGGPLVGLLMGAVAGLLIALVPIAIACIVHYVKNVSKEEDLQISTSESDLSDSCDESQVQDNGYNAKSGPFFPKPKEEKEERSYPSCTLF